MCSEKRRKNTLRNRSARLSVIPNAGFIINRLQLGAAVSLEHRYTCETARVSHCVVCCCPFASIYIEALAAERETDARPRSRAREIRSRSRLLYTCLCMCVGIWSAARGRRGVRESLCSAAGIRNQTPRAGAGNSELESGNYAFVR